MQPALVTIPKAFVLVAHTCGTGMNRLEFTQLVDEALDRLPQFFKDKLENIAVIVEDYPEKGLHDNKSGLLLGLFRGVPRTRQSVFISAMPAQIILYQKNIERICRTRDGILEQIDRTLKHEIGHYFGLSERELRKKGY